MATTMPQANGQKRPSLSEQINRLDKTLDGLADGLNDAVADAVRSAVGAAVRAAVQDVLMEVFSNPDILAKLRPFIGPGAGAIEPAPTGPSAKQRLGRLYQHIRACIMGLLVVSAMLSRKVQRSVGRYWRRGVHRLTLLTAHWQLVRRYKFEVLTALGIGVTVGMSAWYAGPWFSALTSGIGGFFTTLAVQAGLFVRKMFARDIKQLA